MATAIPFTLVKDQILQATAAIPVGVNHVRIEIDRTAGATPLNSLPATDLLRIKVDVSLDGGQTFPFTPIQADPPGGIYLKPPKEGGGVSTISFIASDMPGDPASTTRQARGQVQALNGTITGTVTVTLS